MGRPGDAETARESCFLQDRKGEKKTSFKIYNEGKRKIGNHEFAIERGQSWYSDLGFKEGSRSLAEKKIFLEMGGARKPEKEG